MAKRKVRQLLNEYRRSRLATRALEKSLSKLITISPTLLLLLTFLKDGDTKSARDIRKHLVIPQGRATHMLKNALKIGFIARHNVGTSTEYSITDTGTDRLAHEVTGPVKRHKS